MNTFEELAKRLEELTGQRVDVVALSHAPGIGQEKTILSNQLEMLSQNGNVCALNYNPKDTKREFESYQATPKGDEKTHLERMNALVDKIYEVVQNPRKFIVGCRVVCDSF